MPAPDYASELAQIDAAMASGELTIEANGERVTYRSVADLQKAREHFVSLATVAAAPNANRGVFGFSAVAFERD